MCQCLVRKSRRRGRYGEYVVTRRGGWWVRLGLGLDVGLGARLGLGARCSVPFGSFFLSTCPFFVLKNWPCPP